METNFNGGISDSGPLIGEVYLYYTYHGKVTRYGELKSTFSGRCIAIGIHAIEVYMPNSRMQLLNALKD